jgi:hypothetical protein
MDENQTIVAYFKQVEATPPPGFVTWTDDTDGFSIFVPDGWDTRTMEEIGAHFFSFMDYFGRCGEQWSDKLEFAGCLL